MSTRSTVALQEGDTITAIYCHNDGDPGGVGRALLDGYATEGRVRELLAMGDCSSLGRELGEAHAFDAIPDGKEIPREWSTFYGRDRGETLVRARRLSGLEEFVSWSNGMDAEFVYLYTGGQWTYLPMSRPTRPFRPLAGYATEPDDEDDEGEA